MTIEGVGVETGYKYISIQIPLIYVIIPKCLNITKILFPPQLYTAENKPIAIREYAISGKQCIENK